MIMIMETPASQVDSPVAEGNRKEGGGRKIRDLNYKSLLQNIVSFIKLFCNRKEGGGRKMREVHKDT